MNFRKKQKQFKVCPRCGLKCLINADSCLECGLVFSRLQMATNADAKAKIKRREKEYILYTSTLPQDVSFFKLIVLCFIGGLFGAHSFYVGRYWRGLIALIPTLILVCFTIFNAQMVAIDGTGTTLGMISTVLGFFMFMWPCDIVLIFMKKFKVPVAIDIDAKPIQFDKEVLDENNKVQQEVLHDIDEIKNKGKEE